MKLTISKTDLLAALSRIQSVAARKSTMPILSCVHLTAADGTLTVRATNLQIAVTTSATYDVKGSANGTACVTAKDLIERVRAMPTGGVSLSVDSDRLTVKASGSSRRYVLPTSPADDFPPASEAPADAPTWSLPAATILSLLSRTKFAVSTDETRIHLNSLLIEREGSTLRAVATDGHRLSLYEAAVEGTADAKMLVPLAGVAELDAFAKATGEPVTLTLTEREAYFASAGTTLAIRTADATFPPYKQVIPQPSETCIIAPREALADAIRAVSIAASDKTSGVVMRLAKGKLTITANDAAKGDGADEVDVEVHGVKTLTVGASAKYLLDALGAETGETVRIEVAGELDPIVFRGDVTGVVMPMRV